MSSNFSPQHIGIYPNETCLSEPGNMYTHKSGRPRNLHFFIAPPAMSSVHCEGLGWRLPMSTQICLGSWVPAQPAVACAGKRAVGVLREGTWGVLSSWRWSLVRQLVRLWENSLLFPLLPSLSPRFPGWTLACVFSTQTPPLLGVGVVVIIPISAQSPTAPTDSVPL